MRHPHKLCRVSFTLLWGVLLETERENTLEFKTAGINTMIVCFSDFTLMRAPGQSVTQRKLCQAGMGAQGTFMAASTSMHCKQLCLCERPESPCVEVVPLSLPSGGGGWKESHQDVRGWNATVRELSLHALQKSCLLRKQKWNGYEKCYSQKEGGESAENQLFEAKFACIAHLIRWTGALKCTPLHVPAQPRKSIKTKWDKPLETERTDSQFFAVTESDTVSVSPRPSANVGNTFAQWAVMPGTGGWGVHCHFWFRCLPGGSQQSMERGLPCYIWQQ